MKKSDLIEMIKVSFDGVQLENGVSIKEAQAFDTCFERITDYDKKSFKITEETENWQNISFDILNDNPCYAHMDHEGLRYYLPALMIVLLEHDDISDLRSISTLSIICPQKMFYDSAKKFFEFLTEKQKKCIAYYLKHLPEIITIGRVTFLTVYYKNEFQY